MLWSNLDGPFREWWNKEKKGSTENACRYCRNKTTHLVWTQYENEWKIEWKKDDIQSGTTQKKIKKKKNKGKTAKEMKGRNKKCNKKRNLTEE